MHQLAPAKKKKASEALPEHRVVVETSGEPGADGRTILPSSKSATQKATKSEYPVVNAKVPLERIPYFFSDLKMLGITALAMIALLLLSRLWIR